MSYFGILKPGRIFERSSFANLEVLKVRLNNLAKSGITEAEVHLVVVKAAAQAVSPLDPPARS